VAVPSLEPIPDPDRVPAVDPRSIQEQTAARLTAIVQTSDDGNLVVRAARLLASEDMKPGVKELTDRAKQRAHELRMIPLLATARETIAEEYPGVDSDEVEHFIREFTAVMLENDDCDACYQFWELAKVFEWTTEAEHQAAKDEYDRLRAERIKAGKKPAPEPPPSSILPDPDGKCALG
jgi:hypothetical protein